MDNHELTTGTTGFIIFLLLPHYQLPYLELFPVIDKVYDVFRVLSALAILVIIINDVIKTDRIRGRHFVIVVLFIAYYAELMVSTALNHVSLKDIVLRAASQLSVFLICNYYAAYFRKELIKALLIISEVLVYLNFIVIIFNKDGLYRTALYWNNWLFGYKNNFFQFFIGFIVASFLYKGFFKKNIRIICLNLVMFISVVIVGSATAMISMLIFYFLALVIQKDNGKRINALSLTIANCVLFVLVVLLRVGGLFNFVYDTILRKSTAIVMRVRLWDRVLPLISNKYLLGYGYRSSRGMTFLLGAGWATHAHNIVLQVLLEGGVISLLLYIIINIYLLKEIQYYKNSYVAQILAIGIFVLYVSSLFEVYYRASTFVIYGLASSVGAMVQYDTNNQNERKRKIRVTLGLFA